MKFSSFTVLEIFDASKKEIEALDEYIIILSTKVIYGADAYVKTC